MELHRCTANLVRNNCNTLRKAKQEEDKRADFSLKCVHCVALQRHEFEKLRPVKSKLLVARCCNYFLPGGQPFLHPLRVLGATLFRYLDVI